MEPDRVRILPYEFFNRHSVDGRLDSDSLLLSIDENGLEFAIALLFGCPLAFGEFSLLPAHNPLPSPALFYLRKSAADIFFYSRSFAANVP